MSDAAQGGRHAQRLGKPAAAGKQPLGFLGHVGLPEMLDQLNPSFTVRFAEPSPR